MFQTKVAQSEGGQILVKSIFEEIDFSRLHENQHNFLNGMPYFL